MTVKQLIEQLKKIDPALEVWTEGCDCYAEASGVILKEDYALITRED